MKSSRILLISLLLALVAGCASVDSRIGKNQAQFDRWPTAVQQKIRAEQVDVGFTQPQVLMALGEADRKYTRTNSRGTAEVWAYLAKKGGFSIGLGMGSYGGSSSYGGGVGVNTGSTGGDDERVRVIFENGVVTSVEARSK